MSHVDLGFIEDCAPFQLDSYSFPSKVGGKPAWLDLENLPTPEDLLCATCQKPLIFLCQIYAPYEEDDNNFHRTLFVFICRNAKCCKRNTNDNIKVFRNSLRRDNKFYFFDPVEDRLEDFASDKWVRLCSVCGCSGSKQCSRCKKVTYCSREHQVIDWKDGHKNQCAVVDRSSVLFPEFEVVIEAEDLQEKASSEDAEIKKFQEMEREGKTGSMKDVADSEIAAHAAVDEDKAFSRFKERINCQVDQILRYERGGQPLWIADSPRAEVIPSCESCGASRQFEFQIMPQLLSLLKENELDWGVILVYSCSKSCATVGYKKEFVFKQDVKINI